MSEEDESKFIEPDNLPHCGCGEPSMFLAMNNDIAIYYCTKCAQAKDYEVKMTYKERSEIELNRVRSVLNDAWVMNLRTTDND